MRRIGRDGGEAGKWEDTLVAFGPDGAAGYALYADGKPGVLALRADFGNSAVEVAADGETLLRTSVSGERTLRVPVPKTEAFTATVRCVKGGFTLERIGWETD